MNNENFMNKFRWFFGLQQQPPRNDFRNPIWGSDDDDDDGDELYTRHQMDEHLNMDLHEEITRQVQDMFQTFGGMFGEMKSFFKEDLNSLFEQDNFDYEYAGPVPELPNTNPEKFNSNSIRDYYLKPGYHSIKPFEQGDVDLDGKVSSQDISGLFKKQDEGQDNAEATVPFDGNRIPGRSFCKTVITTSVRKPDGTIETRKIIKNGNEVIEDTITSSGPDSQGPTGPGIRTIASAGIILPNLSSLFKNFY